MVYETGYTMLQQTFIVEKAHQGEKKALYKINNKLNVAQKVNFSIILPQLITNGKFISFFFGVICSSGNLLSD